MNYKDVRISRIVPADETYRISQTDGDESLRASIESIGVIHPPILQKKGAAYIIVCGFRRISVCRQIGKETITARILAEDFPVLDALTIAITENNFQRALSLVEKSAAIAKLSHEIGDDERLFEKSKHLGLAFNPAEFDKIGKIYTLNPLLRQGIQSEAIGLPVALKLDDLPEEAKTAFAKLFNELRTSLNKQRELLTLVEEIALREDRSIAEILESDEVVAIMETDADRNLKTARLRHYLKRRRTPSIIAAYEKFETAVKAVKFPPGVTLTPPEYFEGQNYTLTIRFRNMRELRARQRTIDTVIETEALRDFIK